MNTDNSDKTVLDDKTVVSTRKPQAVQAHVCPACQTQNPLDQLERREYRCSKCNLELAHLDYTANGSVRGVFGWLIQPGGIVLDRYQVHSVLGKGGFGAAYLVDDLQLSGKRRALKEVPESLFDEYETLLLSKIDHPAIPDIIERRAANGMVYQVLKFGGSRTLGSERRQYPDRRIPLDKLLPWMRQLCEVLIYLHGQNPPIIHRDLKPDNILLNEDERIMLIDFGIAKESKPDAQTRTVAHAATMGFSPPEQVMGTGTDERADIYAMGATFYALMTGQNPPAAHERVAGKELPLPSDFAPDIDPELEDAIIQSLELNMHHRQQSVKEFAAALGGMELGEVSRPVQGEAQAQRTVAASRATGGQRSQPTGLKLPTGRAATTGSTGRRSATRGVETPTPDKPKLVLPLVGIAAALVAIGTGAYLYFSKPAQKSEPPPVNPVVQTPTVQTPTLQTPAAQTPAVQAPTVQTPAAQAPTVQTPAAQAPTVQTPAAQAPTVQTPAVQAPPAQPIANIPGQPPTENHPTSGTDHPASKGSAEEMLKSRPQPVEEKPPVRQAIAPRLSPPKPKPRVVVRPLERVRPRPSGGGSEPTWTIIPGGSHRTD